MAILDIDSEDESLQDVNEGNTRPFRSAEETKT